MMDEREASHSVMLLVSYWDQSELVGPLPGLSMRITEISSILNSTLIRERKYFSCDWSGILNVLDVFVLTARWKGLPRVVLEAVAAGISVVATAVDGIVEALEGIAEGTCESLIAPGDFSAW